MKKNLKKIWLNFWFLIFMVSMCCTQSWTRFLKILCSSPRIVIFGRFLASNYIITTVRILAQKCYFSTRKTAPIISTKISLLFHGFSQFLQIFIEFLSIKGKILIQLRFFPFQLTKFGIRRKERKKLQKSRKNLEKCFDFIDA